MFRLIGPYFYVPHKSSAICAWVELFLLLLLLQLAAVVLFYVWQHMFNQIVNDKYSHLLGLDGDL